MYIIIYNNLYFLVIILKILKIYCLIFTHYFLQPSEINSKYSTCNKTNNYYVIKINKC